MTDVRTAPSPTPQGSGEPQGDYIWYELMTPDPDGAKAFYDAVVGWNIHATSSFPNGYRMIQRSDGGFAGGVLPLTADMQEHGAWPMWLGYINVGDVDETVARIEQAGGRTWMATMDIPNVGRVALVSDPQGAPFYVMKPIPPANDPNARSDVFSPDAEQRVGWNELSSSDPAGARRFYSEQFGWESNDFMPMGEMGEYRFLDHHGQRLGALCSTMSGSPSQWRFYFRVPSISAAKIVVEQKGGTVAIGPHQVPSDDWIIIGTDPQGASFALVGGE